MFRENLSAPGLYKIIRDYFNELPDHRQARSSNISLADALLSAQAMFFFKSSSMLGFEKQLEIDPFVAKNIKNIFQIKNVPADTTMREIIDQVDTEHLKKLFKTLFSQVQRGKELEDYVFYNDSYLISIDGTGFFSSGKVHCPNCCVKEHRDGSKTYYHQAFASVLVHPDKKQVIPFAPEPISFLDGSKKNDCERSAAKRFIENFRREHPHLKAIITADGLASNDPFIKTLNTHNLNYILSCKSGDHSYLFEHIEMLSKLNRSEEFTLEKGKVSIRFRFANSVPLNASTEKRVNFLEIWETKNNQTTHFSWVTDIKINQENAYQLMKGGRSRWRIENETFNTLKNQGYEFEHNYGHGQKSLSNNLMVLMMLTFFVDQIQAMACKVYQLARSKVGTLSKLWEKLRSLVSLLEIPDMESLMKASAFGVKTRYEINST